MSEFGKVQDQVDKLTSWLDATFAYLVDESDVCYMDEHFDEADCCDDATRAEVAVWMGGALDEPLVVSFMDNDCPVLYDESEVGFPCFTWPDLYHMVERIMREADDDE